MPLESSRSTAARLDSWKQIAVHFGRDVRTVRRWEGERNLPVHRLPGRERSGVFAYVDELEEWRHSSHGAPEISPDDSLDTSLDAGAGLQPDPAGPDLDPVPSPYPSSFPLAATSLGATIGLATNGLATNGVAGHRSAHTPAVAPSPADASHAGSSASRKLAFAIAAALLLTTAAVVSAVAHTRHRAALAATHAQPSPEAQELYLQGRYYWNRRTEPDLTRSVDLFTQSIVHDPKYAAAYSGLADSYILLRQYGHMPDSEAFPRALAAARQAVELDDTSPDAHRSLAFILNYWTWDFVSAEREFQRAIELNPKDPQTRHWYASALASQDRAGDAIQQIDIARSLDPLSVSILSDRALFISGTRPLESAAVWHGIEQTDPSFLSAHRYMSDQDLVAHRYATFFLERRKYAELSSDQDQLHILDDSEQALKLHGPAAMYKALAEGFGAQADQGRQPPYTAAHFYVYAGEFDQANRYLQICFDRHDPSFLSMTSDALLAPLRVTPGFQQLAAKRSAAIAQAAGTGGR